MQPIDPATRTYSAWAEAFTIFAKYDTGGMGDIAAEHDIIYAGPSPEKIPCPDLKRLEVLGWYPNSDLGCFYHHV